MSVSTHPVSPQEVMAFLDGELTPERAQSVSIHIEECAECQKFRDSFRSTSQTLGGWSVPAVPERVEGQVSKGVADIRSIPPNPFISDLRRILGRRSTWALGAMALAVLMIFLGRLDRPSMMKMASERAYQYDLPQQSVDVPPRPREGLTLPLPERGRNVVSQGKDETKTLYVGRIESEPMIARTVSLSIVVKDFDAGRASLDAILARHNGYAANLSASTPQSAARVIQASLRIPEPQLAATIGELKALGRVENETQNGEEVTQQHADLVARLKNSRETEQRLQDVLRTRTGKVKDVLEVEEEIARVRGEIEQMEAEQKTLEHRVEFATIDLKLAEEYKAQLTSPAPSAGMQLRNAIVNGFRNASESLLSIILFLAEAGPTLLLWLALLFIPARLLWRRYRRIQALGSLGGVEAANVRQ